jgi:hypothetical protein
MLPPYKILGMSTTSSILLRSLASFASGNIVKTASIAKEARSRRWLEDEDLIKLCQLCKSKQPKNLRK